MGLRSGLCAGHPSSSTSFLTKPKPCHAETGEGLPKTVGEAQNHLECDCMLQH
uniref:Uncharacterized protein n=1 Tax=Anguilla anguilla TaxID=7936 RepID=A0A0E9TEU8_ANGAN